MRVSCKYLLVSCIHLFGGFIKTTIPIFSAQRSVGLLKDFFCTVVHLNPSPPHGYEAIYSLIVASNRIVLRHPSLFAASNNLRKRGQKYFIFRCSYFRMRRAKDNLFTGKVKSLYKVQYKYMQAWIKYSELLKKKVYSKNRTQVLVQKFTA